MLWKLLPFYNNSFSPKCIDSQLDFLPEISNGAWNIFKKRGMHLIYLNIKSLLSNIDEMWCIAKLTNTNVIGLTKTKMTTQF